MKLSSVRKTKKNREKTPGDGGALREVVDDNYYCARPARHGTTRRLSQRRDACWMRLRPDLGPFFGGGVHTDGQTLGEWGGKNPPVKRIMMGRPSNG